MSSSVKNSIKTKNLHIGYQQKKSVLTIQKNINFQLFKGEFVGILGKNGIGIIRRVFGIILLSISVKLFSTNISLIV